MPQPMPLISRGVPAYTNDDFSGAFPATNANNATYGGTDYWRCAAAPAASADSGVLCQSPGFTVPLPVYLAYDLSSTANLGQVLLHWDQSAVTGQYNPALISFPSFNTPTSYTIDVNAAAGGSLPSTGWITLVTVSNSAPYHSRQHLINMTGYKWVQIYVTAITGSGAGVNSNCALNMDVHSAPNGATDSWLFTGDSITQFAFEYNDAGGMSAVMPQQIANAFPSFFPVWEDGGIAGWTATDAQPVFSTWLALFPGKYVALNWGTNDANNAGVYLTNFSAKMTNMVQQVLAAGKIPIIPHIPWGRTTNLQANVPTLNAQIDTIIATNPGTIAGPDLYTYFFNNQSLIDTDGIHPTNPTGYNAYRTQWINWATGLIYFNVLSTAAQSSYKVRMLERTEGLAEYKIRAELDTAARSQFKVQLRTTGPKPYAVLNAGTEIVPARPYTTITSTVYVVDQNNVAQNTLSGTVTVTFPDNTTAVEQVDSIGNGAYSITYNTKGAGTLTELWTFTDTQGSQAEYQHYVPVSF